jgi:hypothetical protein
MTALIQNPLTAGCLKCMVRPAGIEPATCGFDVHRSHETEHACQLIRQSVKLFARLSVLSLNIAQLLSNYGHFTETWPRMRMESLISRCRLSEFEADQLRQPSLIMRNFDMFGIWISHGSQNLVMAKPI